MTRRVSFLMDYYLFVNIQKMVKNRGGSMSEQLNIMLRSQIEEMEDRGYRLIKPLKDIN